MDLTKIKELLTTVAVAGGPEYAYLFHHVPQVEKWAKKILKEYPGADSDIVLASVWLHDIGNVIGDKKIDHAMNSEKYVLENLPGMGIDSDTVNKIARCVRTHRCNDIIPESVEAKILAISDSLSHMTDSIYFEIIDIHGLDFCLEKLERDYRDKSLLTLSFQDKIDKLYDSWKSLLLNLKEIND